jgi:hypothetical protein
MASAGRGAGCTPASAASLEEDRQGHSDRVDAEPPYALERIEDLVAGRTGVECGSDVTPDAGFVAMRAGGAECHTDELDPFDGPDAGCHGLFVFRALAVVNGPDRRAGLECSSSRQVELPGHPVAITNPAETGTEPVVVQRHEHRAPIAEPIEESLEFVVVVAVDPE